jgi:hypothetical protein
MITEWYNDREYLLPFLDEMLEQSGSNEDWKREFTALIPEDMFEVYNTAAIFFTGAPLEVSMVRESKSFRPRRVWVPGLPVRPEALPGGLQAGYISVSCKGYYEAVDANDDPISA